MQYKFQRREQKQNSKANRMDKSGKGLKEQYENAVSKRSKKCDGKDAKRQEKEMLRSA